jgi:hypothetical protein
VDQIEAVVKEEREAMVLLVTSLLISTMIELHAHIAAGNLLNSQHKDICLIVNNQ